MVKALLGALLLSVVVTSPAAAESQFFGDCGFSQHEDPTRPGVMSGPLTAEIVLHGTDNPVSAIVRCWVTVDGVPYPAVTFEGTGVVVGAQHYEYQKSPERNEHFCMSIDFTSDDTPTYQGCYQVDYTQIPPQEVYDLLEKIRS